MKKRKVPKEINYITTVAVNSILYIIIISVGVFAAINLSEIGEPSKNEETYEYNGHTWVVHQESLPLSVEDLLPIDFDGYDREKRVNGTILAENMEVSQRQRLDTLSDGHMPILVYTVTTIKASIFYDLCKNSLLKKNKDKEVEGYIFADHYEPIDAAPWLAEEAYQLHRGDGVLDKYMLCYGDRIIQIMFDWEPTEEQMRIVSEKLGGYENP